jgi:two-component system chemotaxis response regulator CheY
LQARPPLPTRALDKENRKENAMHFLIVDDSKMIRHIVSTALNELGYDSITEAANVGEAKNLLKGKKFDCIISDWHMPGESGLDLLKFVKSQPEYAKIPFIIQTTENEKKNIVEAVKAGVQGYLFKPVQKAAIAQKLTELSKLYPIQLPSERHSPAKSPVAPAAITGKAAPAVGDKEGGIHISMDIHGRQASLIAGELTKQDTYHFFELKTEAVEPRLVCIGPDRAGCFSGSVRKKYPDAQCVLIVDSETSTQFHREVDLWEQELGCLTITVADIAKNRTAAYFSSVIDTLVEKEIDSSAIVIAFGCSALIHLAGFTAAVYKGGLRLVVVPNCLSDLLDFTIGTNWTIGASKLETAVSARHDPTIAWFDTASMIALPVAEYAFACAELFRYAFFAGQAFVETIKKEWKRLVNKDPDILAEFIRLCTAARISIDSLNVQEVFKQSALNFARPIADAIRRQAEFNPGQVMYRALSCICDAAKTAGILSGDSSADYIELLQKMPLFELPRPLDSHKTLTMVLEALPRFEKQAIIALPGKAGSVVVKTLPEEAFLTAFKSILSLSGAQTEKKTSAAAKR